MRYNYRIYIMPLLDSITSAISNVSPTVGNTLSQAISGRSSGEPLTLGAKNTDVTYFRDLVYASKVGNKDNSSPPPNTHTDGTPTSLAIEFDRQLYDAALNLPEAKTVSFEYTNKDSDRHYGLFKGGKVYKSLSKTPEIASNNVKSMRGWLTLDGSDLGLAELVNEDTKYVINIADFTPERIVKDFTPLYNKLKNAKYNKDESVKDDTKAASSEAATNSESTSKDIIDDTSSTYELEQTAYYEKDKDGDINNYKYYGLYYPDQITIKDRQVTNSSVYNNVQAVIYDLPNCNSLDNASSSIENSFTQLYCYQQPESVSYTAAAQYDSVSPRGSQQPFQFYQSANTMNLGFTLKWHIDEIRTMYNKLSGSNKSYTIQEIAKIAEDFTRPWQNGASLNQKVCKVILPGVSHIGYITEAQINYSGDMSGDYSTGSGVLSGGGTDGSDISVREPENYFYSQLEVTFNMIIIKDVQLYHVNESGVGVKTIVYSKDNRYSANTTEQESAREAPASDDLNKDEANSTVNNSNEMMSPVSEEDIQASIDRPEPPPYSPSLSASNPFNQVASRFNFINM
jgi:hypothetical protein